MGWGHQTTLKESKYWEWGTPHILCWGGDTTQHLQKKLSCGWVGGSKPENNTTLWLHLASWNLPDSQISWESIMEQSVAKKYLIFVPWNEFCRIWVLWHLKENSGEPLSLNPPSDYDQSRKGSLLPKLNKKKIWLKIIFAMFSKVFKQCCCFFYPPLMANSIFSMIIFFKTILCGCCYDKMSTN